MENKEILEEEKIKEQVEEKPAEPVELEETGKAEVEGDTATPESGEVNEAATGDEATEKVEENPEPEAEPVEPEVEKMLTQSQVNELVGKVRAEGRAAALKELFDRYGVNDDKELNDIFGRGQGYEILNDEYKNLGGKYKEALAENALLKSKIVPNRWDDVKAILSNKGLDISSENIEAEIATHPEWREDVGVVSEVNKEITPEGAEAMANGIKPQPSPEVISKIKKIGGDVPEPKIDEEDVQAMKMFGLN